MDFKAKIDFILNKLNIRLWKLAEDSELGTTLEKAYTENREMRPVTTKKFLQKIGISEEWWTLGKGEAFTTTKSITHNGAQQNGITTRETFYRELIEDNDEYSILPRAVLKDYKIVPDKIIDVIITSNENEKRAIKESKELEIESLNKKHEFLLNVREMELKECEKEIEKLKAENEELRRKIPPQSNE
jgi:hypothetical protein